MAINPIAFARTVNEQFLRYQLTAFPIADEALARQAEESIRGIGARPTPLMRDVGSECNLRRIAPRRIVSAMLDRNGGRS
jgi:hypothetical protein